MIFDVDSSNLITSKMSKYPNEYLWRLTYIGLENNNIHKYKLSSSIAPHIYLDDLILEKQENNKYKIKKGSTYLGFESEKYVDFKNINNTEFDIIIYQKIVNDSFLNSKYKTNKLIKNITLNAEINNDSNIKEI